MKKSIFDGLLFLIFFNLLVAFDVSADKKYRRFSGVAIGIYRYAATIFALRQVILLTQLYFAFSKVLFLSSREVKANII